jgi:hypothetical protein
MTDVRKCSGIFAAHQAEAIQKKDLNVIFKYSIDCYDSQIHKKIELHFKRLFSIQK